MNGKSNRSLSGLPLDGKGPWIMGVLNITPDSFSDGGKYLDPGDALSRALQIAQEGADILDIGAESSRPGAVEIPVEKEWSRLEPVLKNLKGKLSIPISIDTRRGEVARRALDCGAAMINDVSGGADSGLLQIVSQSDCAYVLMHRRGNPGTMMELATYRDVVNEVKTELQKSLERALEFGIQRERICIDPGFGFSKLPVHNWEMLQRLEEFKSFGCPILVGMSRKRMLKEFAGEAPERLKAASVTAAVLAAERGASILRVHDVAATKAALQTLQNLSDNAGAIHESPFTDIAGNS